MLRSPGAAPPRARQYTAFNACLLTDSGGIAADAAAPVWAGMQAGSDSSHAKVSYLAVVGPATVSNTVPYLNTLIARHCDLVLAAGEAQVQAALAQAPNSPQTHFVIIADGPGSANVATVAATTSGTVNPAVRDLLVKAADGHFAGGPAAAS